MEIKEVAVPKAEVSMKVAQEPPASSMEKLTGDPISPVPVTPPPKVRGVSDRSAPKHVLYKSHRCGSFCRDCRRSSFDPTWFRSKECVPAEFKAEVGENEDIQSPAEGEAESILAQVEEAQLLKEKLVMLKELREEEARLEQLLLLKAQESETARGEEKMNEEITHIRVEAKPPQPNPDNLETLPWEPDCHDFPHVITPEEKVKQQAMVLKGYEKDMEGYENDKMKRHDKTFIDPLARNFKCPRVEAVVAYRPEPDPSKDEKPGKVEGDLSTGDGLSSISMEKLADLCRKFQHSADSGSNVQAEDLIHSFKRSLDEMLVGASPSGNAPLEKPCKSMKTDCNGNAVALPASGAETRAEAKTEHKTPSTEAHREEDGGSEIDGEVLQEEEAAEEKGEDEQVDQDVRPAAVERATWVSPAMQTKLAGKKPNDEEDEEEESEAKESGDEDEDGEEKPSSSTGRKRKSKGRKRQPKARAKAKAKAKGKAAAKRKSKAEDEDDHKKGPAAKSKAKAKALATAKGKAKGKGKKKAKEGAAASPDVSEDGPCLFCLDKKKFRSFQCCAYKFARTAALREGKDQEEAVKLAKQVAYLKFIFNHHQSGQARPC